MHGPKAFLLFAGFIVVALFLCLGVIAAWKDKRSSRNGLLAITVFLVLWLGVSSAGYIRRARFLNELSNINASDVYSVQIGKHDLRDQPTIDDVVGALRQSHWFEVNHGGWGDSVHLVIRRRTHGDMVLDVARYFREPAAIVGPSNPQGLGYSTTHAFAPELLRALEKHSIKLPDCDSAHDRPCSADQLQP